MAESKVFECSNCGITVESWSDGNPYYYDLETGKKKYAYHPDHENLALCVGNDEEHICLSCGHEFKIDNQTPIFKCPECSSDQTSKTFFLDGVECPLCKNGLFKYYPERSAIS